MPDTIENELLPWREIIAKAVHDMRSPLSCMVTTVEILRMTAGDPQRQAKAIGMMDDQINELVAQMDNLLKNPAGILPSALPSDKALPE